jgi:uncharacterized protein with ParB-like and HNH nuclease domain
MGIVFNQPQTIAQLLEQKLIIPEYQRPYKWQPKHVNQLIEDIFTHRTKPCYQLVRWFCIKTKIQKVAKNIRL